MAIQAQMYSGFGLGGSQDLLMENACGLNNMCFVPQQQKLHQEHESVQRIPFLSQDVEDRHFSSQSVVSSQLENQRIEIDLLINSQNERLRMALQEHRKRQITLFIKRYESRIESLIKQKDDEIAKAATRNFELQTHLRRMEMERQAWERAARESESMVESLNSTIQRAREAVPNAAAEDAESCCCVEGEEREETWGRETRKMVCRCCDSRESCVIMLPCRHLCSCRSCDAFLESCPVCKMAKKASVEALV